MAIIGGKDAAFPWINYAGVSRDFGTDGGAHNFLRFLENGDQPVNYMGATATFFYSRQAVGTFKCCNTVYGAPTRNYLFRHELQHSGAAATQYAGVPRHERCRFLAGTAAG